MSAKLPLFYSNLHVGDALVDEPLAALPTELRWCLHIPQTVRRSLDRRPDLLAAALREDDTLRSRCIPQTQLQLCGRVFQLRLSRVALRPEIVHVLLRHFHNITPPQETLSHLTHLTSNVRRIIFLNSSRTDCRVDNLREVTDPSDDEGFFP